LIGFIVVVIITSLGIGPYHAKRHEMDVLEALKTYLQVRRVSSARDFEMLKDLSMRIILENMDEGKLSLMDSFVRYLFEEQSHLKNTDVENERKKLVGLGKNDISKDLDFAHSYSECRGSTLFSKAHDRYFGPLEAYDHSFAVF
jgi:hypothetical protein